MYVNRAQGDGYDPVSELKQYIQWEEPDISGCYLFSGLRGSGKTTELNRLKAELQKDGIAAFYCDASIYLNLNNPQLGLAELLMAALAGLADAVRKEYQKDPFSSSIWERIKNLLDSNVNTETKLKVGIPGIAEVEATLQDNPDFREKLISFAQQSSTFYDEAAKFARDIAAFIRQKTEKEDQKIVLIIDSLERISAPSGDENKLFDSLKEIFFNEPARLRLPSLSVVYSVPPYLHAVLPGVKNEFHRVSLPNFNVVDSQDHKNPEGTRKMAEIVSHRFPGWREIITEPALEDLAWKLGGNVRLFFSVLRTVAIKAQLGKHPLPIDTGSNFIAHALNESARPLLWLTSPDLELLKRFMKNGKNPAENIKNLATDLPPVIRLFDHSLVLDYYQDGDVWYGVPPLVRDYVKD
ncbi:hypothetical protein AGMMS50256_15100 [Betaproteobacteria bacterium]|nr:hypothetical protein AGMMS50256_15100 [Betaproteobacteria bacterium]